MATKSQGTHVYVVDTVTNPATPALVKLDCPTGVSGIGGGAKNQINATCLDALTDEEFVSGLATPTALSVPYNFDPSKASHHLLNALKASGDVVAWIICLSDGTAAPTLTGDNLTAPVGRTSVKFSAYVSENSVEIATNELVKGTLSLQRSGAETWTYKA